MPSTTPLQYALIASTLLLGACASTTPASDHGTPALSRPVQPAPVVVPPTAGTRAETPEWWYRSGAARAAANGAMQGQARNVIVFIGDGMSMTTVAAARILEGQRKGGLGEENLLSWEEFPATALAKTYNTDAQTPDSAGTMTAMATGVKSHSGAIAVAAGGRDDCAGSLQRPLMSWLQLADSAGLATGVVSTARITHATPAATFASVPDRDWENDARLPAVAVAAGCRDIAQQLLSTARFGSGPRVVLGGGRTQFMREDQVDPEDPAHRGLRRDGRDLIAEWRASHPEGRYAWNNRQFQEARTDAPLLGLFQRGHMQYEHDRDQGPQGEPDLASMTRAAIANLQASGQDYVLLVESGRIDHAHHEGNAFRALDETIALSDAVRAAVQATADDHTLVIVTADHGHTLHFAGYPDRGNPILGKVRGKAADGRPGALALDRTGLPYTTLGYANGPGNTGASDAQPAGSKHHVHEARQYQPAVGRPDLAAVDTTDPDYLQEALLPLGAETHSGEDVPIWARGPGSGAIRGTVEQHVLYHFIVQATPRLRKRLCRAGTCNVDGVPVELPRPGEFEQPGRGAR